MNISDNTQITSIVIVGGGTAGWLSAAYLNKALNSVRPNCKITLIESSDIPTVGVGEATLPTLSDTFKFLGIAESDWMHSCNATFKLGIKFVNWSGIPGKDIFWHPFDWNFSQDVYLALPHYWLKRKFHGNSEPFDYSCFEAVSLCEAQKSAKYNRDAEYTYRLEYAYHLDAGLLATYLKEKSKAEGVNHIVDNVLDVCLDERGFISHVITENNGNLEGDLFIDCSGFRGLLINQALQEPFISYSDSLFCDRAIALALPYEPEDKYNEKNGGINPYTTATALSSGWVWHTPLIHRSGNGYVYSSAFISPGEAEVEFKQHLGKKSEKFTARHLKMRVGRTRNTWVNNCVSIGLSSGFIEPLESTGIYLIEVGLENLLRNFPNKSFPRILTDNYNQTMRNHYEEIRDFIVMHYCLTHREDSAFWQANKNHSHIPESLQEKLELWQSVWPSNTRKPAHLFPDYSYMCILAGMDYFPQISLPILDYDSDLKTEQLFSKVKMRTKKLRETLPNHVDYLKGISTEQFRSFWQKLLNNSANNNLENVK